MKEANANRTASIAALRDPFRRLSRLLDEGSPVVIAEPDDSNVCVARGSVGGAPVIAYCTDGTRRGGAIGALGSLQIASAIENATRERSPVIGLWHSGGAQLTEGVEAMDGIGRMFSAMIRASGRVPQISVVLGPAAGGTAYGPALTDVVIIAPDGRIFVTGPDVVRSVTGEEIDMEGLGGPVAHGRNSGTAHMIAESEDDAFARARRVIKLFARPGRFNTRVARTSGDLRSLLPKSPRRAYDPRPLVRAILDPDEDADRGDFVELQADWAPNVVVGLGRLCEHTVGVIANNPLRKGGCLDSLSAEKASRFVRMCDSFGIPLVTVVDVPGYLPGVRQEWEGVVRRGAKLLYAFGEAVVPRVTLVTRKSYGGAYIAMNSRSLGATAVFAWPEAEIAVMRVEAAVRILHRKVLATVPEHERVELETRLAKEYKRLEGGVERALALGVVDEVIDPADTRRILAEALAAAPARRGDHGNIPL